MRTLKALSATCVAVSSIVLASCGGGDSSSPDVSGPAKFAPADAPIYLEATLRPEGDQKTNAEALLSKLGDVPLLGSQVSPDDLADQAVQQFNAAVGADVDYATDVAPWLGDKAGLAVTPINGTNITGFVLAVDTSDDSVARDSLAKIIEGEGNSEESYDGVDYFSSANGIYSYAVFDGALVFGTTAMFKEAVDADHDGDSLGASDEFASAMAPLGADSLARAYVDFDKVGELSAGSDMEDLDKARGIFPELFDAPLAMSLSAGTDSVALDTSLAKADDEPPFDKSDKLDATPSDAFAAVGIDDAGGLFGAVIKRLGDTGAALGDSTLNPGNLESGIEQQFDVSEDEIESAFGDGVAYATGDPANPAATLKLSADDDSATGTPAKVLDGLKGILGAQSVPADASLGGGFLSITAANDPDNLGDDTSTSTLGGEEKYTSAIDALGSDFNPLAYANLEPILESIVGSFSLSGAVLGSTPPNQAIAQFVAAKLDAAAAGTRIAGDRLVVRSVVTLGE